MAAEAAAALDAVAKAQDRVVDLTRRRSEAVAARAAAISRARDAGCTLARIAQVLDVTVERVRQMQRQTGAV